MLTRIVIPVINGAIGESIFAEELKGDFAAAGELAERAAEGALSAGRPELLAEAQLARGVLYILQGEPKLADAYLAEAEATVRNPGLLLRVVTFRSVAASLDRNYFPDGGGARGAEITAGWEDFEALAASCAERAGVLEPQVTAPGVRLERAAAIFLLNMAASARAVVTQSAAGPAPAGYQEAVVRPQRQFRSQNAATADPRVIAYTDLVLAGLYQRAGSAGAAQQSLRQGRDRYAACGDSAGMAACRLAEGDWLSAPFSSPLTWNMSLDGQLSAWVEVEEFRRAGPAELDSAAASYAEAGRLFASAGARRGLAAVQLRQGYLAMLAGDWRTAAQRAGEAERGFGAVGDRVGQWLAAIHRCLATIGVDRWEEDLDTARAVGLWGTGPGSFSYALGLGVLCSRAARHWLIRRGDAERALACYRCAHALFEALGASANVVQNLADQAHVLRSAGDLAGEMVTYEQAVQKCVSEAARRPELGDVLGASCIQLTTSLWDLAQREMNPDEMERAASRLTRLLPPADQVASHLEQITAAADPASGFQRTLLTALPSLDFLALTPALAACYRARKLRDAGRGEEAEALLRNAVAAARQAPPHLRDFLEAVVHGHRRDWQAAREAYLRVVPGSGWPDILLGVMEQAGGAAAAAQARLQQVNFHTETASFFCRIRAYAGPLRPGRQGTGAAHSGGVRAGPACARRPRLLPFGQRNPRRGAGRRFGPPGTDRPPPASAGQLYRVPGPGGAAVGRRGGTGRVGIGEGRAARPARRLPGGGDG